jgi:multiple sugar transport system permease protein
VAAITTTTTGMPTGIRPVRRRFSIGRAAAWTAMGLIVLITLLPFYWILRTALSTNAGLNTDPANPLPVGLSTSGFERALGLQSAKEAIAEGGAGGGLDFWRYLLNSVIVSTLITGCQIFFSAMAAYAFARLRWPGRDKVFFLFLTAMMIPPIFTLIPNFVLIKNIGLLNTIPGIVAPFLLMTPFAVFFLRQFFLGISREVEEAAILDGAGRWRIFRELIVPMSIAPLTTLAVLTYITSWKEYMWPLVAGDSEGTRVLTVALNAFKSATPQIAPPWAPLMAATFLAAIPIILLFALLARRMVDAIGFSGIK